MSTPRRHDHDASGDPDLLAAKAGLREQVWDLLESAGAARFPGVRNRISNFRGAEAAADRLADTDAWQHARTLKANPDSPQWPVRQRALESGHLVYMAVPRLAEAEPFFLLDPDDLRDTPRRASSIRGASASARTVAVADMRPVDLVVTGCVAVGLDGVRLGKGGGFSDLEFAIATEAGLVDDHTVVATTVHPAQVLDVGEIPHDDHDVLVDLVVTSDEVIEVQRGERSPARIRWDELSEEKIAAIPVLERLRVDRGPTQ
ncbi:MAG: 5-formyltetrahydrofolate cyclo-ligase [Nitriliruptoraceae bacterium]